jgi:GTP-binding protein
MLIKGAKFITSAATESQFLRPEKPMIAVCGKSNSGKSTLINMLANQKNLAKTSSSPGRTRLVNYFDFGPFWLADLPGYGYAAVSREEQQKWAKTLDRFFDRKEEIAHVFLLSDIRRDPSADDIQMVEYLNYHILPFTVLATKADKVSRMKQKERVLQVARGFSLGVDNVIAVSALTGDGKDALLKKIQTILQIGE